MADFNINDTLQQIKAVFAEMSLVKKAALLITVAVSLSVLTFLVQLSNKSNYQVLFSNLKSEDIGQIAAALDQFKVPYQVQSETQSILVPGERVLETRLKLAKDGLPRFGGIGFEIFDQKSFGMTEFEQRLNFQRALQGELVRTINELEEVEDARVHLVIPEKTIFSQSREEPSASIVVKLASEAKLSEATVQSIVHLVSSSVPNLSPKKVTVVDTAGQMMTQEETDGNVAAYRKKEDVERNYENKVRELLEPIVGFGKVQVQVTADLDFTTKETTEEKYDPESIAVRSESRNKLNEKSSSSGSGGAVGATAAASDGGGLGKDKNEQSEKIEYEVSKQIQRIVTPTGDLEKLSVAVIVDGTYTVAEDGKPTYAARTADEIKNYEDLVKSAIGFQQDRGDQLKVMNLAFQNLDQMFAPSDGSSWQEFWGNKTTYAFYASVMINVIIGLIGILVVMFVVRPILGAYLAKRQADALAGGSDGAAKLNPNRQALLQTGQIRDELQKQALQDPDNMVNILKSWLS